MLVLSYSKLHVYMNGCKCVSGNLQRRACDALLVIGRDNKTLIRIQFAQTQLKGTITIVYIIG